MKYVHIMFSAGKNGEHEHKKYLSAKGMKTDRIIGQEGAA